MNESDEFAKQVHTFFVSLRRAGFTEAQATQLTSTFLFAAVMKQANDAARWTPE